MNSFEQLSEQIKQLNINTARIISELNEIAATSKDTEIRAMDYSSYLAENLDKSIQYSNYIAKNIGMTGMCGTSGPQGIAGMCGTSGSCGVTGMAGTSGKKPEEILREERKAKLEKIIEISEYEENKDGKKEISGMPKLRDLPKIREI